MEFRNFVLVHSIQNLYFQYFIKCLNLNNQNLLYHRNENFAFYNLSNIKPYTINIRWFQS